MRSVWLVMRAIFRICANEIQPGLQIVKSWLGEVHLWVTLSLKKIRLLHLGMSTLRENTNALNFTELFPTTPDDRGCLPSMIWFRISFLGIIPDGCHCFPITPDFAVCWETLTFCPRFHSDWGRNWDYSELSGTLLSYLGKNEAYRSPTFPSAEQISVLTVCNKRP